MSERLIRCIKCGKKHRWNYGYKWKRIITKDDKIRYVCPKCPGE